MKVFKIRAGVCYYDATRVHPTLASTVGRYPPDCLFAEAPDYVFEGWGFDDSQEGDARFVQPQPPEGWLYDPDTGTFYPADATPPEPERPITDRVADLEAQLAQADDTAIELFEGQMAQEEINAAQDDALIDIYEMIGG